MPSALVLSGGVFAVLWLLLKAVQDAGGSTTRARKAFWATVVVTSLVYLLYLVAGESWIWY